MATAGDDKPTGEQSKLTSAQDRELRRMHGGFAVLTFDELIDLVYVAYCAAFRISDRDERVQPLEDILRVLADARAEPVIGKMHKLAMQHLAQKGAEPEPELVAEFGPDFARAMGNSADITNARFRLKKGGKQALGEYIRAVVSVFNQRGNPEFVDMISGMVDPQRKMAADELKLALKKQFPGGPSGNVEEDALGVATVVLGDAKSAWSALNDAAGKRLKR